MTMNKTIEIRCINLEKQGLPATMTMPAGCTLEEVYAQSGLNMENPPLVALVNNRLAGLHYCLFKPKQVEFLDVTTEAGVRAYTRTLFFVLCKALYELYPGCQAAIDIPVSNGYYVDLDIQRPVTLDDVGMVRRRMAELIAAKLPIRRHEVPTEEAIGKFEEVGAESKVKLLRTQGSLYTTYYELDGYCDYFYGAMLVNTGQLSVFGIEKYFDGLLLRIPSRSHPQELGELVMQPKMFAIFQEHHRWQDIIHVRTVGDLNVAVGNGFVPEMIQVAEALQEKKMVQIAEEIARRKGVRLVLIAGPSSSGKTTTCRRLSVQLVTHGIRPVPISLDDYFVDRDDTPRDEQGDYDFEHLHALNLPLLNQHMNALFAGEEVELPRYDFPTGKSMMSGKKLRLKDNEVLVVEGIHALNPELMSQVPPESIYRVYASALTTLMLDSHNYVATTDNRLLRRLVRDYKYRGVPARETIRRWPSVRKGENRWIFPFQENADQMFNTALFYELAVLKTYAEPLLRQVPENCPEFAEAQRLCALLDYIAPIPDQQLPPTSLLREFLGGSSFRY